MKNQNKNMLDEQFKNIMDNSIKFPNNIINTNINGILDMIIKLKNKIRIFKQQIVTKNNINHYYY